MDLTFKPIEIQDIPKLEPFYGLRPNRTCDSIFLESYIWKEYYNVQFAIWENKALLWLMEMDGRKFSAMPLCRPEDLKDAFDAIERYFNENLGFPLVINLADAEAIELLDLPAEKYLVEEQLDSRDYLYDGQAMRTLAGKKLHKKKNRLNAFMRNYEGRFEYRRLTCGDGEAVWNFLEKWRRDREEGSTEDHLDYEARGICDILRNCGEIPCSMGGVFIDGELEAFTIGGYNESEKMAVIPVEKANPEIDGIYQYINQQFLLDAFPEAELVNREDDMGLEGLRQAKLSYNPCGYARKFLVQQLVDGQKGYHWAERIENTAAGPALDYLEGDDRQVTRQLYEACFPEDSAAFTDYYYKEKVEDNRVLVKKDNGLVVSMTHLNPYPVEFRGQEIATDYLAAVSTAPDRQREGHYRDLFDRLLADQQAEGKPFTWLVPVNPEVYKPFGFTFVSDVDSYRLTKEAEQTLTRRVCTEEKEDLTAAAAYMERWLGNRAELHTRRTRAYVKRFIHEMASEDGTLEFLLDGEEIVGLYAEWGFDVREVRLFYAEDRYVEKTGEKPWAMARVCDVKALLSLFRKKPEERDVLAELAAGGEYEDADGDIWDGDETESAEKLSIRIRVEDPILSANCHTYEWTLDEEGSEVEIADGGENAGEGGAGAVPEPDITVTPEELVRWLFGKDSMYHIWPEAGVMTFTLLNQVDVIKGVYLDELV